MATTAESTALSILALALDGLGLDAVVHEQDGEEVVDVFMNTATGRAHLERITWHDFHTGDALNKLNEFRAAEDEIRKHIATDCTRGAGR